MKTIYEYTESSPDAYGQHTRNRMLFSSKAKAKAHFLKCTNFTSDNIAIYKEKNMWSYSSKIAGDVRNITNKTPAIIYEWTTQDLF